jgi:hypothetical protein
MAEDENTPQESEEPDFTFSFKGNLRPRVIGNGEALAIDLDFGLGRPPYMPASTFVTSRPMFETEEQANAWYNRTRELFFEDIMKFLVDIMGVRLWDAANLALIEADLVPFTKKGVLQSHLALTEKIMRARLKVDAGRPAKWTAPELAHAITEAMRGLRKELRTYAEVAKKLQEAHPGRAPKNGESLRKTVDSLEIDWKRIKRDVEERKRS